ncbi:MULTISPECIES: DUF4259 domain-containing protein [unclassified Gordonia (in: high G+C Gram-positive bacteria)]|uniref:DUF4259 domain-containing protein n=1 Tax=unclassified Gordonia (in: high G+C Gram-positive bacteria) TaxID=2657482 RepID=UPI001F0D26DE|nr:DUF4259 domain-containing protein [Gordonia sp. ABSL49_1]MCH5642220.1 DUF4259 domain-containing protein [Gordonia sp. ABSL49_1]
MGAWGSGIFDNDDAADWVVEFDEADPDERLSVVQAAFDAVTDADDPDELEIDVCSAALAAVATVAALMPGGPEPDESYGPQTLDEAPFEVSDSLRSRAVTVAERVLDEATEWSELWIEADRWDEAKEPVRQLVSFLRRSE